MIRAHANWLVHARLEDYLVAAGAATSSLPVIGRHLEPVCGMAALSVWGARYLPDFMSSAKYRLGPGASGRRTHAPALAGLMSAGLCDIVAAEALAEPWSIADGGSAMAQCGSTPAVGVPRLRPVRRRTGSVARRLAARRPRGAGPGARFPAGRRVGFRQAGAARPRADGPSRGAGLGVLVGAVPNKPPLPLAPPDHRCEGRHRVGARERRPVRRRPQLRRRRRLFGRRTHGQPCRPHRRRRAMAVRPARRRRTPRSTRW